ncbi:MAG: glycosyltransferase family 4 protein [Rubrobacteraceae bacterium]
MMREKAMANKNFVSIQALQIGHRWFPEFSGGLHRMYYELFHHLPSSGVVTRGLVAGTDQVGRDSGKAVRAFAAPDAPIPVRGLALRRELRRMISERRPDLVAAHFALYTFPVLDKLRPYPLVFHFHGPWAQEGRFEGVGSLKVRAKATLEQIVYRRATHCIVLSDSFRDILHEDYGVPLELIYRVPGGVDADQYDTGLTRKEARERLGWPQDRPTVFTARRLVRRMGLETLISAMSEVRRHVPEALLSIAGKGELFEELGDQVRSLGLEDNVELLGFVPEEDLAVAYRAADLSVVPTVALEGFGLVAVESLAAGTPVLVTPVGGLPEVVRELSENLVLPSSEVGDLAEGIEAALTGRRDLPDDETCQSYARTRFDWPVVAAQTRDVYMEALG